jgi:hypothetical protein
MRSMAFLLLFFFHRFFVIPFKALWRAHARHFCVVKCGANWQTQTRSSAPLLSYQTRRQVQKVYTHAHTESLSLPRLVAFTLDFFSLRHRRDFQGEEQGFVMHCTMLKTFDNRLVAMQCFPFHAFPMWRKSLSGAGGRGGAVRGISHFLLW